MQLKTLQVKTNCICTLFKFVYSFSFTYLLFRLLSSQFACVCIWFVLLLLLLLLLCCCFCCWNLKFWCINKRKEPRAKKKQHTRWIMHIKVALSWDFEQKVKKMFKLQLVHYIFIGCCFCCESVAEKVHNFWYRIVLFKYEIKSILR